MAFSHLEEIKVGVRAPGFKLHGTTGLVSLSDLLGQNHLLLYFVREFGCHTCMQHAVSLAKIQDELQLANTRTVLIGGGNVEAAQRIASRYKLPYPVLADPKRAAYAAYGFNRTMLVIQTSGIALVDRVGIVRYIHRSGKPSDGFNRQEVLNAVSLISG